MDDHCLVLMRVFALNYRLNFAKHDQECNCRTFVISVYPIGWSILFQLAVLQKGSFICILYYRTCANKSAL
jgi:hypothetical protein